MNKAAVRATLVFLSIIVSLCILPLPAGHAGKPIQVTYQGRAMNFAASPFNRNNVIYIQARPFAETLGFRIDWLDRTRFSLTKGKLNLVLGVGSTSVTVDGRQSSISPAPVKVGATLFLPLRAIAERMRFDVSWDASTNTVAVAERGTAQSPGTPSASAYKVVAYYPFWGAAMDEPISAQPLSKLTHLNYAFANISGGQVVLGDSSTDIANFKQLEQAKSANPGLRTLISVGGWTWSGQFSDIAATSAARKKFAASAVSFMRQYGFDGVDLDWEYPVAGGLAANAKRKEDKTNFTLLLSELRSQLDAAAKADGREYLLTIATGAFPAYVNNVEIQKVASLVDWMNLMTYDFHGDWDESSGHLSALYADSRGPGGKQATDNDDAVVSLYLQAGVPASKLVLGVPFYGRSWTSCEPANNGLYQACDGPTRKMYSYETLKQQGWIGGNGFVRYWNDDAKVPYLYKKTTGTFVSYEDAESIGYKISYLKSKKLGGAMIWELTQDDQSYTLLNALIKGLQK